MANGKQKFYLWTTNSTAGLTESYEECQNMINGQPGGRCMKKYSSKEEAENELANRLKVIENSKKVNEGKEVESETEEEQQEHRLQSETIGHDDRYEEIQNFINMQKGFNEKFEKEITKLIIEIGEQAIEIKDADQKIKSGIKEMKLICKENVELMKTDQTTELQKLTKELSNNNTRLSSEIGKLKGQLTQYEQKLNLVAEEIEKLKSIKSSEQSPPTQDEQDEPGESTENQNGEMDEEIFYNVDVYNRYDSLQNDPPFENSVNGNITRIRSTSQASHPQARDRNARNPLPSETQSQRSRIGIQHLQRINNSILILSDSMYRGIIQSKFAPERYVNKQYIAGGTQELINHLREMNDNNYYEYVIIHTGTNDVLSKYPEDIIEDFDLIMSMIQEKWPRSKIGISGIIYSPSDENKNRKINNVNNALESLCLRNNHAIFIDNSRVACNPDGSINENAFYDDIHLNNRIGTKKLVANIKYQLRIKKSTFTRQNREQVFQQYNTRRNRNVNSYPDNYYRPRNGNGEGGDFWNHPEPDGYHYNHPQQEPVHYASRVNTDLQQCIQLLSNCLRAQQNFR